MKETIRKPAETNAHRIQKLKSWLEQNNLSVEQFIPDEYSNENFSVYIMR